MFKRLNICSIQNGYTVLHRAAIKDHTEIIDKLINCGCNIDAVDSVSLIIIFCFND